MRLVWLIALLLTEYLLAPFGGKVIHSRFVTRVKLGAIFVGLEMEYMRAIG
jgi:hypothetical protein